MYQYVRIHTNIDHYAAVRRTPYLQRLVLPPGLRVNRDYFDSDTAGAAGPGQKYVTQASSVSSTTLYWQVTVTRIAWAAAARPGASASVTVATVTPGPAPGRR